MKERAPTNPPTIRRPIQAQGSASAGPKGKNNQPASNTCLCNSDKADSLQSSTTNSASKNSNLQLSSQPLRKKKLSTNYSSSAKGSPSISAVVNQPRTPSVPPDRSKNRTRSIVRHNCRCSSVTRISQTGVRLLLNTRQRRRKADVGPVYTTTRLVTEAVHNIGNGCHYRRRRSFPTAATATANGFPFRIGQQGGIPLRESGAR